MKWSNLINLYHPSPLLPEGGDYKLTPYTILTHPRSRESDTQRSPLLPGVGVRGGSVGEAKRATCRGWRQSAITFFNAEPFRKMQEMLTFVD